MKTFSEKSNLKRQVITVLAVSMTISNTILLFLLFYNFYVALSGVSIPIDGEMVEFYFTDHLEERLLIIGTCATLITIGGGIATSTIIVNRLLDPINKLSRHMSSVERDKVVEKVDMETYSTETEILLASFNRMAGSIEEAFETQRNISSYIAHELRTPLTVMQTKTDVYRKMEGDEVSSLADIMDEQIDRMNLIINRILEFAGIQRAELSDLVPPYILIEEVYDDLEEKAEERDVSLELVNATSLRDDELQTKEVVGSHELLYQALSNIIGNAIKYNVRGGRVEVSILIDGGRMVILVADTGEAIPDEEREKIFSPFYRCVKDINTENKGNGIGLALADKIIRHHSGSIALVDREGYSNTFRVELDIYGGEDREGGKG